MRVRMHRESHQDLTLDWAWVLSREGADADVHVRDATTSAHGTIVDSTHADAFTLAIGSAGTIGVAIAIESDSITIEGVACAMYAEDSFAAHAAEGVVGGRRGLRWGVASVYMGRFVCFYTARVTFRDLVR